MGNVAGGTDLPGDENSTGSLADDPEEQIRGDDSNQLVESNSDSEPFCLLYTSPSPRDKRQSRMPSSA